MDRERLVDETLMLLPTLMRLVERPSPVDMGEISRRGAATDVQVSPGHIQVLIALARGPRSVGQLAEELGVSPPAATQPEDRLVVLVDYVAGMRDVARRIVWDRRRPLHDAMSKMTDGEALAFVKGLRLLAQSLGAAAGEEI